MADELMVILNDMRDRMARMETKIDRLNRVEDRAEKANETANKSLESAHSAHYRIDGLKSDIGEDIHDVKTDTDKKINRLVENLKWMWGAFVALLAIIVTAWVKLFGGGS